MNDVEKFKQSIPKKALTKLWICFKDGSTKTIFSFDSDKALRKKDFGPGMRGLIKRLIENKYKDKFKVARIYANNGKNEVLAEWNENGVRKT